ncbi:MAG: ABC transporter ATP-binding protein/permease [Planctomycetes bacterium]|nr:ABC transporter ATP-binding protein/permease [Planctomycetota bacterium]
MKRFRTILAFAPRYRGLIVLGFVCLVASRTLALAVPKILGRSLDEITRGPALDPDFVAAAAILLVAVSAVLGAAHFGMRWFLITTSRRMERDLRNHLFGHLLTLDPAFYQRRATGDLMSRASFDVEQVRLAIGPGVMYIANTIFVVPLALALMLAASVPLSLVAILPLSGIAVVGRILAPRMQILSRKVQESAGRLSTRAQESFAGARVVKVFAREENEIREFDGESKTYLEASMRLAWVNALLRPSLMALEGVGSLVLLFAGGRLIVGGEFTVGQLLTFYAYQRLLVWPMIAIGWVLGLFQRGAAAMIRIDEILAARPLVPEPADPVEPGPVRGDIEIRGLTFAYDGTPVLRDVSLAVPAGTSLAVVGPTGSGKSTLAGLLLRQHPVPEGTVFLDGIDLTRWPTKALRSSIGAVPQETVLFSDTIRANIAFGRPEAPLEAVVEAARKAGLDGEVAAFPAGFETLLGERGVNLSGGQKQRTALARALLLSPPVLILDDAFSSVDTETEERILASLAGELRGRTTILVSHRVSTVRRADRIAVLDQGRIVETGTHDELLRLGGRYAALERRQRLAREVEALA